MAAVRIRAAATSMLAAYGFVLLTLPLWFLLTGNLGAGMSLLRMASGGESAGRVAVAVAVGLVLFLAMTWRGMVGAMLPVLTGRTWVVNAVVYLSMALGIVAAALGVWKAGDTAFLGSLLDALPWILGLALAPKLALAAVSFRAASRRGMISRRGLISAGLVWIAPIACVLTICSLLPPLPWVVWLDVAMAAALFSPIGRLALAPLALDWNRHR
jgi:hypothetical protein